MTWACRIVLGSAMPSDILGIMGPISIPRQRWGGVVGQAHQKLSRSHCRGEWINPGDLITWREDGSDSLKARLAASSPTSLITHPGSCQKPLVLPPLPPPWSSQMAPTCLAHTSCFLSSLPAQPRRGSPSVLRTASLSPGQGCTYASLPL